MGDSCGDCGHRSFGSQEEKRAAQVEMGGEGRQQAEAPSHVVLRGGVAPGGDGGLSWQGTREGSLPALAEAGAPPGFQGSPGRGSSKSRSQSRAHVCVCGHGRAGLPLPTQSHGHKAERVCVCVDAEGQACVLFRSSLGPPREWAVIRRFVLLLP